MIASEKQSFISDINDLRSSLDKLTNNIDRLMEIEKDEEWNYYEDTYISVRFFSIFAITFDFFFQIFIFRELLLSF